MTSAASRPALPPQAVPLPPVWASLVAAAVLSWWFWGVYTHDIDVYLIPWMEHILETGPIRAFATPFSNYTPPYLYLMALVSPLAAVIETPPLIKLLSLAGTAALALAVRRLLVSLEYPHASRAAALALVMPTLLANAVILHQCDALWTAAAVMALACAVERRHVAMFLWCGFAVAIKAQGMLIAPFFLALAIGRRLPIRLWLLAPLGFVVPMVPAALAGWPVADLATIYLRQSTFITGGSLNAPNIWIIAQGLAGRTGAIEGVAMATALTAVLAYVAWFAPRLRHATPTQLVAAAAMATLLTAGLLPRMHERYFFLADTLAFVIVLMRPDKWRVGVYTQLGSGAAILAYLSTVEMLAMLGAVAMLVATWQVGKLLVEQHGARFLAPPRRTV